MNALLNDDSARLLGAALGTVLPLLIGLVLRGHKRAMAERIIDLGIPIAFHVVEEISRHTRTSADDKVAKALEALRDYARTRGVTVTPEQEARARLVFKALHAQSKVAR